MTKAFIAAVDRISQGFAFIATGLLIIAMLVVCQMIFLRYVFRWPTVWQTDFVVYAATAAIFLGAPYVLMRKGHVGVDVLETVVSPAVRWHLRLAGAFFGIVFCALMLVASGMYVHEAWSNGWETNGVWQIPLWMPTLPLVLGFGLLCLQYVAEIAKHLGERP
jgi:TRAP-type C4-dicarboxylate transport system permease small subunit